MINNPGLIGTLIFTFTLGLAPIVNSGELRPLNLPSTQRQQAAPVRTFSPPTPTVYDRFRDTVRGMDETQKGEYRRTYQASLNDARAKGDQAAVSYYQELLRILN